MDDESIGTILFLWERGIAFENRLCADQHRRTEYSPAGSVDAGPGRDEVYIDKSSGKSTDRPELKKMLSYVRRGDTVIVESISRFARNTKDLLELIEILSIKEVTFISRKESIDTTTPTGKFMLTVFGAVAELEREYILQRQKEGITIAKANGRYKGRKPVEHPDFERVSAKVRSGQIAATTAMKQLGMSKSTFYRRLKNN